MSDLRYYRWDFDNREMVQYERQGECNGCGACCRALISFRVAGNLKDVDPRDLSYEGAVHVGVWAEVTDGIRRRLFTVQEITPEVKRCSALSEDNKCTVHNLDKPRICEVWPVTPDQVTPFPECSYSFTEIGRWKLEDLPAYEAAGD